MVTRPAIFKWRQTEPGFILCAVRWYLRYSLSLRDVEELLEERGLNVDHTTVWRWVQCYGPELEWRMRRHLKPTNKSWQVDETYVRVKGLWCYLYRVIDSKGATIDLLLSALRDAFAYTQSTVSNKDFSVTRLENMLYTAEAHSTGGRNEVSHCDHVGLNVNPSSLRLNSGVNHVRRSSLFHVGE